MAAAPDYKTLRDFKTQFEKATYQILAADGITAVMPGSEEQKIPWTAVAVRFDRGGATGEKGFVADQLNEEYDTFEGTLLIENIVDYRTDQENEEPYVDRDHARRLDELIAQEDALFLEHLRPFADALEWLEVLSIMPIDPDEAPESEREVNVSRMRWRVVFRIRPEAWPTVSP